MGYSQRIRRIILDTSALMLLYDGVQVFEEAEELLLSKPECIVPKPVIEELERIASAKDKTLHQRRAARLALQVMEKKGCKIVDVGQSADDAIIELARALKDAVVVTADNELRRRLRELGLPNIYYRKSRHGLMLEA
ncbi:hypothetical protein PYJP_19740 [Pyrofollis japonicus]|uniref:PIN domain-containing protein n=1 Tax=Pyrofollis japonicus TaxID=3060460 RepID=UPI00295A7D52|nr:PIN domain-containing protein [Pyrofollis japonicus]BEP18622.1 hypothetical protein PYJP_19740 [Pyrofollis japonicus]